jgi:hypothetical protein
MKNLFIFIINTNLFYKAIQDNIFIYIEDLKI